MLMAEQAARGDSKATIRWASKTLELAPGSPEALLARGKAHLERKEYAKGKTDLLALSEDFLGKHPDVMAEFLVASVSARDWGTASELAKSVPEDSAQTPEVKAAIARIPTPKATATPSPSLTAAAVPVPAEVPAAPTPTKVPASTPEITPVPVPPVVTPVAVKKSAPEEARELLRNGKAPEAKILLKDALQAAPTDREVRKALLEVSVMSRDWKLGAEQLPALDPMADSEAPFMFYAAVCLFETGDIQKSRDYLKRARPRITSSPFVDYYSKKILGTP
jgi:tetratricopeptide (TPR) repeat protein